MIESRFRGIVCASLLLVVPAGGALAESLDWEVDEDAQAVLPIRAARNVRDGLLTFGDAFMDANTALFGLFSLSAGQLTMAAADTVGLVDDNAVTQHVTKAFFSKNLAKVAYLWHVAGSESLLGGHGLEVERWAMDEVAALNPLLGDADVEELAGPLPLDPLDFVGEAMIHTRVYRPHAVLLSLGAVVVSDVVLRPAAGLLRIFQLRGAGDALERRASDLVRRATKTAW